MRECRFYPWCSYMIAHGCTRDYCVHYKPMPDVGRLLDIANRFDGFEGSNEALVTFSDDIREACGADFDADLQRARTKE